MVDWRLSMPDGNEMLFRVIDLKQYLYCKRILYYHTCLPDIRPTTHKMQAGIDIHETEQKRAARRMLYIAEAGVRHFDVSITSHSLSLNGQIDEVIEVTSAPVSLIPVDYKLAKQASYHYQVQLAAYALMLEEQWQRPVSKGYLYLIPLRQTVEVPITTSLRNAVRKAISEMREIVLAERMPLPTDYSRQCVDCEFRRFCNDVL